MSEKDVNVPKDVRNIAYIILFIQGVGFLLPWNVFITAKEYFEDYKLNTTISADADYRKNFLIYLGMAAQFPVVTFSALNVFYQKTEKGNSNNNLRMALAMGVEMFILLITIILAFVDTTGIPGVFFAITICSVVVINCCVGVHQTLTFGIAACLPMKYSNIVITGSNACGAIISLVMILTKAGASMADSISSKHAILVAGISYFIAALIFVIVSTITYFLLVRMEFVAYHSNQNAIEVSQVLSSHKSEKSSQHFELSSSENGQNALSNDKAGTRIENPEESPLLQKVQRLHTNNSAFLTADAIESTQESTVPTIKRFFGLCCFRGAVGRAECHGYWDRYVQTFKEAWVQFLGVYLVFLCSLALFPAVQSRVTPNDPNYFISANWFTDITCFLFFNLFAMLGSILSAYVKFPKPKYLIIPIVLRLVFFVPFFLLSNVSGRTKGVVLITNDHVYTFGAVVFGLSNGYLSSLCMMYAPMNSPPERAQIAGMMAAFFLVFGVFSGIYCNLILVAFI